MIRALVFDCFGVLTTDTWRAFLDSLPDGVDIQRAHDLNHAYDAGYISRDEFVYGVYEATGQEPKMVEAALASETTKNTSLLDYISSLKTDYKIGLLSNIASDWITSSFLSQEEQDLFDTMVMSYEVGMTKPDPRIFQLVCERLHVVPKEAVLIDDIDTYCQAAQELGMKAVQYHDFRQLQHDLAPHLNHT